MLSRPHSTTYCTTGQVG